jgi:DNA-binding MarR family transcriptional regulator
VAGPVVPEIDGLVHEPARLRLLVFLAMVEAADFMYLLRQTGMSRGNLSVQMSRLEAAGVVRVAKREVDGRLRTTYSLSREGLVALRRYRTTMREILGAIPD